MQEDLGGMLEGQVHCDEPFLQMYATDASLYEMRPVAVVRPMHTEDVVAVVNYARENDLSIVPRGSGSNVLGAVVGASIILDFSFSMRQILAVDRESVRVQPGLVLGDLNQHLASHGKMFGPDPFTRNISTIGGILSLNSSGSHWIKTGTPRDHVVSMEVVTASGDVVHFHSRLSNELVPDPQQRKHNFSALPWENRIRGIIDRNADLIAEKSPSTPLNQAGYHLNDLSVDSDMDLTRLIVGSEGTLGIITEVTLRTIPIPRHRGVLLFFFERMETAATTAVDICQTGVTACDMMDRRLLRLGIENDATYRNLIPDRAEAMLVVEYEAQDDLSLRKKMDDLVQRVHRKRKWAFDFRVATNKVQRDRFWRIARRAVPTLYRMQGNRRAIPFVEDMAVEPHRLPQFLREVHAILNRNGMTASIFSHSPQGTVHVRPFVQLSDADHIQAMRRLATELFEKVLEFNGTISASRGDGRARTWFLRQQYGKLHRVFSEIKNVFDPQNLLNPGKIVGGSKMELTDNFRKTELAVDAAAKDGEASEEFDDPEVRSTKKVIRKSRRERSRIAKAAKSAADAAAAPPSQNGTSASIAASPEVAEANPAQRSGARPNDATDSGVFPLPPTALPVIEPQLNWDVESIALEAQNCNGCGRCRTSVSTERMCPVFRLAPREEASPRAKANLMRGVMTGELSVREMATDEFKSIADLCVNCHQCRFECPAKVDIPRLMIEAKAQHYAVNGMRFSDWMLSRLDWLYSVAGLMPTVTNALLGNRTARWLLDRTVGIAEGRKMPRFSRSTFQRWAQRSRLNQTSRQSTRKVVYFVDAFANWNDVELGVAFCKILQHNKIDVLVPPGQGVSGMSLISDGVIPRAKKIATRNIEMLADYVRQGYQVVTTEPSATLALTHEYLHLVDEEDATLVAENTTDASTYLLSLHRAGELELDFQPVNETIGYHLPCHQRALIESDEEANIPGVQILKLIPGLQVEFIQKGCSGMAGTWGIKRKNYVRSLRMGVQLIQALRASHIVAGTTECSTCRMQMEQGTSKPTIHPIKILAYAYRLSPELNDLFQRRSNELTLS